MIRPKIFLMGREESYHLHCLLLEDQQSWVAFVTQSLKSINPNIEIYHQKNLEEARTFLKSQKDNFLSFAIIDLGLPDGQGVELLPLLKEKNPNVQTVVATIFGDDQNVFQAIELGASGYILKDDEPHLLLDLLRRFVDGEPPLSPSIARKILHSFRPSLPKEKEIPLTVRETETLTLIASGLTVAEAAKQMGLSHLTVAGYVKLIYQKLHICNRAEATYEAIKRGLLLK